MKQKRELVLFYFYFSFIAVVRTPAINCFILLIFYFYFSFIAVVRAALADECGVRVIRCLENLEMSGNFAVVRERCKQGLGLGASKCGMVGVPQKVREM